MLQLALRFRDGIGKTRPWLRPLVKRIQSALVVAGHVVSVDGRFGRKTEKALVAFQKAAMLPETGVMLAATWQAMQPQIEALYGEVMAQIKALMPEFRGDLDWVHAQEGHQGRPYWPGGSSGVTLDPGVDLGHADADLIEATYRHRLGDASWELIKEVLGIKGDLAKQALKDRPELKEVKLSEAMAYEVMPLVAKPYWDAISDRFPQLLEVKTPGTVQTVLLSLAYNRGPRNHHLKSLNEAMATRDWETIATKVRQMQQRHRLKGIRKRRRLEGDLIRSELAELTTAPN